MVRICWVAETAAMMQPCAPHEAELSSGERGNKEGIVIENVSASYSRPWVSS